MNSAYNHGSQGDLYTTSNVTGSKSSDVLNSEISSAPAGVGEMIRDAARDGDLNKLESLLNKWKGDQVINEQDAIGTTALMTAASNAHKDCVMLLLKAGANRNLKNTYGQTAAARAKTDEIRSLVQTDESAPAFCTIQ